MRARRGLPSLRTDRVFGALRTALAASSRSVFRLIHFSVQTDHLHLIVEADERTALIRGVQGLAVRCARAVNRSAGRRGPVWSERYHGHALTTPTEVRRGMVYVLLNFCKHLKAAPAIDPRSSGAWFDGWRRPPPPPAEVAPVARASTWLGKAGWRRAGGEIDWAEAPAPKEWKPVQRRAGAGGRVTTHGLPAGAVGERARRTASLDD